MVSNVGDANAGNGFFNGAVGAFALNGNTIGFSNNAIGDSALFRNISGAQNTAVGDEALLNNDATASGASFNTAVGALALLNNVTGSGNTAWVQGQDQTWPLASITLTSATSLVRDPVGTHFPTKTLRSASATSRTERGRVRQPATSVVSSTTPSLLAAALL